MPRRTAWTDTVISFLVASGALDLRTLLTGISPVDTSGTTLIRTLIRLDFSSNTTAGAWGVQGVDFAIGIASQQAFAVGSTAIPDPGVSGDKPPRGWVYRTSAGVAQNGVGSPVIYSMQADIRGARKIEDGELYIVTRNTAIQGTAMGVNVRGLVRCLLKLA